MLHIRYTWRTLSRELFLVAAAAVWALPFLLLVLISLKPEGDTTLSLPEPPEFANYVQTWDGGSDITLGQALVNSLVITVGSVICVIAIGSICAYVIARRPGKVSAGLYGLFLVGFILPFELGIVPTYAVMRDLHLTGSYLGMILLYTGLQMPFSVFLYTGFMRTLPKDFEEAAYVDGASPFRTFVNVVFPMLRPITATVAVMTSVFVWNGFFVQLIFLSGSKLATVPVFVYSFVGEYVTQWNLVFAAVAMSIVLILGFYLFAQRQLMRGFTGGVKG